MRRLTHCTSSLEQVKATDLIQAPQRSPPTNEVCQYPPSLKLRRTSPKPAAEAGTPHGFAADLTVPHRRPMTHAVLGLLRGESVWRSGRHGSPDRARSQWGSARLRVCGARPTRASSGRPTTASQRVSGHRNPDSRRSNANTARRLRCWDQDGCAAERSTALHCGTRTAENDMLAPMSRNASRLRPMCERAN
jgi:hypothetical protein